MLLCAADVGSAFLHGYTKELVYTIAGPEWGEYAGCIMIAVQSVYCLKTSAAHFHEDLAQSLMKLGFVPSHADTDMWMCGSHHEYISTYVDDLLIMSRDPMSIVAKLEKEYGKLKGMGMPEYYLGGNISLHVFADGHTVIMTSVQTYSKEYARRLNH